MDFASRPPEVNSGLMYAGPGAGPLLAAAAAWSEVAAALESAAAGYASEVSGLSGQAWSGPSSMMMTAAATPYVTWLQASAAAAAQTAAQAYAAAAAYEAAFAMTVPPPVIAANRAQLLALIATNFFGQNTPAIAATEAEYMEFWGQDAVAMYGYAGTSLSAGTLKPLDEPPRTTNPAGQAAQTRAVAQAAGNATSARTQSLAQLGSSTATQHATTTNAIQQASATAAGVDPPLPPGTAYNVAPGGATIGQGVTVTVTPGYAVHTPAANAYNCIAITDTVWQITGGGSITFQAGVPFQTAVEGNIVSGTFSTLNTVGSPMTVLSGPVTGTAGTSGAEVTLVNGAVTVVNSGFLTTGPAVPLPVPASSGSGLGAALAAASPAGGLSGTSGIQPQLNAQLLAEWGRTVGAELAADLAGVPG